MQPALVWYAGYGSNLSYERFICYLKGGVYSPTQRMHSGCSNKNEPIKTESSELPYPLFFARYSASWKGGVAFIDSYAKNELNVPSRLYLITTHQLLEIWMQENEWTELPEIDWNKLYESGSIDQPTGWYNRLLLIGDKTDYPIITFTGSEQKAAIQPPSETYLRVIIDGLKETVGPNWKLHLEKYASAPGCIGIYSKEQMLKW